MNKPMNAASATAAQIRIESVTHAGRSGSNQGNGATNMRIVTPSRSFSAIATAAISAVGTPSRFFSSHTRSSSPARAGASTDAANATIV